MVDGRHHNDMETLKKYKMRNRHANTQIEKLTRGLAICK